MEQIMKTIFKTLFMVGYYNLIWLLLEIVFYGNVEPRIVDTIMMAIFVPTIYKSCEEAEGE